MPTQKNSYQKDTQSSDSLSIVVDNDETGLPEPIQISRDELQTTLMNNPTVLLNALQDLISSQQVARKPFGTNTPVTELLGPGQANALSANARNLTKGDLMALGGWNGKTTARELGLTAQDITTIRDTFSTQLATGKMSGIKVGGGIDPAAVDINCCCCPCCCATAVKEPMRPVA
ncbi:MAG: hypothetical protein JWP00_3888 [Chloroflexi bacterium]|nr:hypothetical protein [Chloroflexota bacterium]